MDSRKLITSAEGKEMVINGWKSARIYDALKHEGKKLPNMDPFPNIDPLMGDNPTTAETNLDTVCQLDQKQLDSFRSQRDNVEENEDKEEKWEPEDHHTNAFDVFDNFDDEPSL